jgi:predicted DNA-binding transcriptional regulator AlpA
MAEKDMMTLNEIAQLIQRSKTFLWKIRKMEGFPKATVANKRNRR